MPTLLFLGGIGAVVIGFFLCLAAAVNSLLPKKKASLAARVMSSDGEDDGPGGVRDQEKMQKSFLDRVIIPMASKYSKYFSSITPAKMVTNADRTIAEAGMQSKVTGIQLVTISWVLLGALPLFLGLLFLPHLAQGTVKLWVYIAILAFSAFLGYRLP
ncbi:MAG: hypothetical protein AAF558_15835, partial [Verrucomicrobiota bacterium]